MVKLVVYELEYHNFHMIRHYNAKEFIDLVNDYNKENEINHALTINKLHLYSSKPNMMSFHYKKFSKIALIDFLEIDKLRNVDIYTKFKEKCDEIYIEEQKLLSELQQEE